MSNEITTVEDRLKVSKRSRAELEYNAAWRALVTVRGQWEGFECKITPETRIVIEGGSLGGEDWDKHEPRLRARHDSLRARLAECTTDYQFARREVEASLGRALTDDEMLRGFGRPIPDGALSEARPWDKNYCPPGFPWQEFRDDLPEPETRWRRLADSMRFMGQMPDGVVDSDDDLPTDCEKSIEKGPPEVGAVPPEDPKRLAMIQRRPLENRLNDLRILYTDAERAMKTAKWKEKDGLRRTMAQLLNEAKCLLREEGGGEADGYEILFPTTAATTGNLPVHCEKSEESGDEMGSRKPTQKPTLFAPPPEPAPLTPRSLTLEEKIADLRRSWTDAKAAIAASTDAGERERLRAMLDEITAEGVRLKALQAAENASKPLSPPS